MTLPSTDNLIKADNTITLELIEEAHAQPLLNLVNADRIYLREWLPWIDGMQTVDDFRQYIAHCKKVHEEGSDYGYVIMLNDTMVGRVGLHYINQQNKTGAIGYWLAEGFQGKGIITKACIAIINYGFTTLELNRIEIKCGVGNYKSAAIPERLNFIKEGILRQAEWVNGKFIDLSLYSLLRSEWNPPAPF